MFCPLDNLLSATTSEASALLKGPEFLERFGCSHCYVESDSLEITEACNGEVEIHSPYLAILADCFLKASNMSEIQFQHCHREANQVAQELAKVA
jgi:hypothetical protein